MSSRAPVNMIKAKKKDGKVIFGRKNQFGMPEIILLDKDGALGNAIYKSGKLTTVYAEIPEEVLEKFMQKEEISEEEFEELKKEIFDNAALW